MRTLLHRLRDFFTYIYVSNKIEDKIKYQMFFFFKLVQECGKLKMTLHKQISNVMHM